jgi:hypothetical protein
MGLLTETNREASLIRFFANFQASSIKTNVGCISETMTPVIFSSKPYEGMKHTAQTLGVFIIDQAFAECTKGF